MKSNILIFFLMTTITVVNAQGGDETLFICKLTIGAAFKSTQSDELKKIVNSHAKYLDQLGDEGKLIFAGRTQLAPTDPRNYGIVVIKARNEKEVDDFKNQDPAVKANLHTWEVLPFSMGIRHFNNLRNLIK